MADNAASSQGEQRVVPFRRRGARAPRSTPSPVQDLAKYERGQEADDYRHRMLVNLAAFLFVCGLIGAGLWLADAMAQLRHSQDCLLAGHRDCTRIEVTKERY